MITEIIVTGIVGIFIGLVIAYPIFKKTRLIEKIKERKINKVLNDPELLKKELEKNETYETRGEKDTVKLVPIITEKEGKKVLEIKEESFSKEINPFRIKKLNSPRRTKPKDQASESLKRNDVSNADTITREDTNPPEENIEDIREDEEENGRR